MPQRLMGGTHLYESDMPWKLMESMHLYIPDMPRILMEGIHLCIADMHETHLRDWWKAHVCIYQTHPKNLCRVLMVGNQRQRKRIKADLEGALCSKLQNYYWQLLLQQKLWNPENKELITIFKVLNKKPNCQPRIPLLPFSQTTRI